MPQILDCSGFLRSSILKVITPLTTTATSKDLTNGASRLVFSHLMAATRSVPSSSYSTTTFKRPRSATSINPYSIWTATITLLCITMITVMVPIGSSTSFLTDAAPSKHSSAPNSLADPMSISISETSALPLQLQIESQARGKWKLAYLPATGPSLDFYYLNYRPTYRAGESIIDFWMLTPKGTPAPMTGSLELYDEFGKIRLAVLVPEGTKIPQNIANKNEPFLWKSWTIPKTLKAEFDFSEKFRVILKTSTNTKNGKRADPESELLVKGNNRHVLVADNADTMIFSSDAVVATAQDRQFRIKGLKASPGGKPNPAKLYVNSVASVATNKKKYNNSKSKIDNSSGSKSSEYRSNSNPSTKTTSPLLAGYRGKIKQSSSLSSANSYIMQSKALVTMAAIFIAGCIAL